MNLLIIDLKGKFANFKKFNCNSSSMSYFFPPRTAVIGLIAAIIGREREGYYEEFSKEEIRIGISIRSRLKKNFHKINYLKIENTSDLNGSYFDANKKIFTPHTGVPFEVVTADSIYSQICYRIFIHITRNEELFKELSNALKNRTQRFPLYLGKAGFYCNYELISADCPFIEKQPESPVVISTVIPSKKIAKMILNSNEKQFNLYTDCIPVDFQRNNDRTVKETMIVAYTLNNTLNVLLNSPYYLIEHANLSENIVFIE